MNLHSHSLQTFLDELAADTPVPGGGSVAALGGALGAALVAMVCRLTIGKKGYEAVADEMRALLPRAEALRNELRDLIQADSDAYARVLDAYKLPKTNDAEQAARARAIQDALEYAADIPARVAERCAQVLDLARVVAEKGNRHAASDGAVGALMAHAGLRGAAFNVAINLAAIQDESFVSERRARLTQLAADAAQREREILQIVEGRL